MSGQGPGGASVCPESACPHLTWLGWELYPAGRQAGPFGTWIPTAAEGHRRWHPGAVAAALPEESTEVSGALPGGPGAGEMGGHSQECSSVYWRWAGRAVRVWLSE